MAVFKKITKNGQITIPSHITKSIRLENGAYVFIYEKNRRIIIKKTHQDNTLNQCIFRNGRLSIPMELRKLLEINPSTLLSVEASSEQQMIIIKISEQEQPLCSSI